MIASCAGRRGGISLDQASALFRRQPVAEADPDPADGCESQVIVAGA